jgi:hypothetical protein
MKRRTRVLVIAGVAVVVCVALLGVSAIAWAKNLEQVAMEGKSEAKAGAVSLASQETTQALLHLRAATHSFASAQGMLGPSSLSGLVRSIPWVGRQYTAAQTLLRIGLDASEAGSELAFALQETSATPTPKGMSHLGALFVTGRTRIDIALTLLVDAADRAPGLSEKGLDARLARAVHSLKDALSEVSPYLGRARSLLALERYLMSSQHRILVVSQNGAELRPGGGFIGTYGILDIGPQGIKLEKYADVYTLPNPPGKVTPPQGAGWTSDFNFRDANWWIDFPTSARTLLGFWHTYKQRSVDGIIAIDVVAVRDLLTVFGPIRVKSFKQTFTADNLLDRLLYIVEVKSGNGAAKKNVLIALAKELERRVLDSGPGDVARSALALANSADDKHVQFYFTDTAAQAAVTGMGWSGAVAPPTGTTDLLAVCNAMTRPGKVNVAMEKSIAYDVTLRTDGSAETTVVLHYANMAPARFSISSTVFRDYLRVYRALGTSLVPTASASAKGATFTVDLGLPAYARQFILFRGDNATETIVTHVPKAWRTGTAAEATSTSALTSGSAGTGSPTGGTAYYRLYVVRQDDLVDIPTTVTVSAPAGWRVTSASAWKTASGAAVPASAGDGSVRLSTPLSGDIVLDIGLMRR